MLGTEIDQLVLSNLFSLKMNLRNSNGFSEITFKEMFGKDYLKDFDEYDQNLESLIIDFCKSHNLHCTKTNISYIFSKKDLNFRRKNDKKLC